MRGISKIVMTATAAGALFALSACGSTETSRTATGAGSGAVAGAVVGGPVGAVVGGVGGAVAGNTMDESLSKKTDRVTDRATAEVKDETSGSSTRRSSANHSGSMASSTRLSHDQVRELQQALNDRNDGRDIAVDGVWGAGTRSALMKFQRDNGLRVTGRADQQTMSALNMGSTGQATSGSTTGNTTGNTTGTTGTMNNTTPGAGTTGTQQ
ncbi:peptidoglycan-binding protein [Azospirillum melinis]|uniref:peptidoglycan-binding domain-containing protein n=1 Tax=Azospirillum melinis TaxID=328839 RepID=UPI003757EE32